MSFLLNHWLASTQIKCQQLPSFADFSRNGIHFLVIVPSIRGARCHQIIQQLTQSFTYPTDLLVMDGHIGKVQVLNQAVKRYLAPKRHTLYATLDDDIIMPSHWQDQVIEGFQTIPNVGAIAIDYIQSQQDVTRGATEIFETNAVQWRYPSVNLPGGNITMRTDVALAVGEIPAIPELGYCHYDDAWRSRKVEKLGLKSIFLSPNEDHSRCQLVDLDDPQEYIEKKASSIEASVNFKRNPWLWWPLKLKYLFRSSF